MRSQHKNLRALRCPFKDLRERMRSLDFKEEFGFTQKGSPITGKSAGGLLAFSPPRKLSKTRKGKGPTTNVSDITLVLVPRAQKEWIVDMEESLNNTIKGGKA